MVPAYLEALEAADDDTVEWCGNEVCVDRPFFVHGIICCYQFAIMLNGYYRKWELVSVL